MTSRPTARRHEPEAGERTAADPVVGIPSTEAFELLGNGRRRATVSYLAREGPVRSVDELSQVVAASEHDVRPERVTERQHKCVYVSLLQIHLPRLAEAGIVRWSGPDEPVEATAPVRGLAALVELVDGACGEDRTAAQRSRESR